jgi:hypothetical protein
MSPADNASVTHGPPPGAQSIRTILNTACSVVNDDLNFDCWNSVNASCQPNEEVHRAAVLSNRTHHETHWSCLGALKGLIGDEIS